MLRTLWVRSVAAVSNTIAILTSSTTSVARVRVLREQARGGAGDGTFAWTADRGLVLTGESGAESLLLALPDREEHALFLPAIGPYRVLADPREPQTPGAGVRELLGYGDREMPFEVTVSLEAV